MNLEYFKKYSSYKEEQNNNKNVWLYTRVSSKKQFDTNGSIENQKLAAELKAEEKKYTITRTFGDTYESAKGDFTRKEFKRLISEVSKAKKKPFAIMIYKMSRFSRTGANAIGLVSKLINTHNVHLIEVSTNKDSTTPRGELEIIESLQYARKENIERLEATLPGMTAHVKNGNLLGKAPRGYDHYGPRVKNPKFISGIQRLEINNEGKLLKKAWKWKFNGKPDYEIRKKLAKYGINISKQFISAMWRNPFYCGIQTNSLLKGGAVKGNWKPLITLEVFRVINETLEGNSNTGYTKSNFSIGRPLQSHLYCGNCDTKMTGYKAKKKYDYYKCQNKLCICKDLNANSTPKSFKTGLNDLFNEYITQFTLDIKYIEIFREQIKLTINSKNKEAAILEKSFNKQIIELKTKIDDIERRYVVEGMAIGLYMKYKAEFEDKIEVINREKSKLGLTISNLNKKIDRCVDVAKNVSNYWAFSPLEDKLRLQKLMFPSGIVIDPIKRQYRTTKVNSVFSIIASISSDRESKSKNAPSDSDDASCLVAGTGLEPVTFGL